MPMDEPTPAALEAFEHTAKMPAKVAKPRKKKTS